jgi:hypothetical protein
MSTANNVFIVTSTINTDLGLIPVEERVDQTFATIASVRKHVDDAIIILVDNSSTALPSAIYNELATLVDLFLDIGSRSICRHFNKFGIKGAGESYNILVALDVLRQMNVTPARIFKISGRYCLSETFDITVYHNMQGKFCFKTRDQDSGGNTFLHSRMWSACGSLLDEMQSLTSRAFDTHLMENITIEQALYKNIDKDKLLELDVIHCEGYIAPWNTLIRD